MSKCSEFVKVIGHKPFTLSLGQFTNNIPTEDRYQISLGVALKSPVEMGSFCLIMEVNFVLLA